MKWLNNKTEGLINFSDLKSGKVKVAYTVMIIFLVVLAISCLLPVVWAAMSALKQPEEMYRIPPTFFPTTVDLSRVKKIVSQVHIGHYLLNTIWIILGCWIVDVLFNGLAGYVLSKIRPKGTPVVETLIFWSMMLPGISMAPLYMTFVDLPILHIDISGTFFPLWIMAGCNAFNIMLFRNFFNGIPKDYMEAAKIDGCSDWKIFFRIILPLSKPVLAVVTIYSVIGSWNNFMWPYLLLEGTSHEPLSVLLFHISNGALPLPDNDALLIAMFAAIPPIIIYAFLAKHINGGLNMIGIKG